MSWIIEVTDRKRRLWVRKHPGHHAYTNKPELAKQYSSYEAAKANCCGNEIPVSYYQILSNRKTQKR